jgi:hypothetical protein
MGPVVQPVASAATFRSEDLSDGPAGRVERNSAGPLAVSSLPGMQARRRAPQCGKQGQQLKHWMLPPGVGR